jgi:hypothetical protein
MVLADNEDALGGRNVVPRHATVIGFDVKVLFDGSAFDRQTVPTAHVEEYNSAEAYEADATVQLGRGGRRLTDRICDYLYANFRLVKNLGRHLID